MRDRMWGKWAGERNLNHPLHHPFRFKINVKVFTIGRLWTDALSCPLIFPFIFWVSCQLEGSTWADQIRLRRERRNIERCLPVESTGRQTWRESGMQRLHHDPNLCPLCTLPYITRRARRIGVCGCVWSGGRDGKHSHVLFWCCCGQEQLCSCPLSVKNDYQ